MNFCHYLDLWETSVYQREGFSEVEKKKMMLCQQTLDGLQMPGIYSVTFMKKLMSSLQNYCIHAVKAFVELVEYLFTIPGVKVFLSEKISQDPGQLRNSFAANVKEEE